MHHMDEHAGRHDLPEEICHDVFEFIEFSQHCSHGVRAELLLHMTFGAGFFENEASGFHPEDDFLGDWSGSGRGYDVNVFDDVYDYGSGSGSGHMIDWYGWTLDVCG